MNNTMKTNDTENTDYRKKHNFELDPNYDDGNCVCGLPKDITYMHYEATENTDKQLGDKWEELQDMIDTSGVEVNEMWVLLRVIEVWHNEKVAEAVAKEKREYLNRFLKYFIDTCRESGSLSGGTSFAEDGVGPFLTISSLELQNLVQQFVKSELEEE